MSRVLLIKLIPIILILQRAPVRIDRPIPPAAVAEDARKKRMGAQLIVVGDGQIM